MDQSRSSLPEQRIGRYTLVKKIARAGQADVYMAKDGRKNIVALKVLRFSHDATRYQTDCTLFRRECEALRMLVGRPNIVQYIDSAVEDKIPHIALELIEGKPLHKKRFSSADRIRDTVQIICGIADALTEVHAVGLVHRDVKKSNVFLREDNTPVLLDFGSVTHQHGYEPRCSLATLDERCIPQTLQYTAPELHSGDVSFVASDIYSLGVMLFELLSERLPFEYNNHQVLMAAHRQNSPPTLLSVGPFEPIVQTAMAKKPEDRYQTAADFKSALQAVAGRD